MKFKTNQERKRGIDLTRNENKCNFAVAELRRMIKGDFNVMRKFPSNDSIYIIHANIFELYLDIDIVLNLDEYPNPDDVIKDVLVEIRKSVDKRVFK